MTVIDFSAGFPDAADIKNAGHDGAILYISPARATWMKAKPATKKVVDDYRRAGLQIGCVWQFGGADAPDVMRGASGGRADALAADKKLGEIGLDGWPVFFAVDFDITLQQWNQTAVQYFRAAVEVLGMQRVGIYGHSRVVAWAKEDAAVADLGGGRCLGWVTRSWSDGETGKDYAAAYQRIHNVDGPSGIKIDINDTYHQAPFQKVEGEKMSTFDVDLSSQFSFGGPRPTSGIKRVVIHTTENKIGTPAENVANYQINSQSGSYHALVDSTGKRVLCNTDGWVTWSTGNNAGNFEGLNLSFVCYSAQTRAEWLTRETMLRAGAGIVAVWCSKYSIPPVKTDGTQRGLCGHGDLRRYGGTDHTDPGDNFPWDIFTKYVAEAMNGPAKNTEEDELMAAKDEIIAAINRYTGDYIKGYVGPIGSDVKDIREQLTGGRDIKYDEHGKVDRPASFPGWAQLGKNAAGQNLTITDGLAAARNDIAALTKAVAELTELVKEKK